MTADPPERRLTYRDVQGRRIESRAVPLAAPAPLPGVPLLATPLREETEGGTREVLRITVSGDDRATGYECLDNEILAGLRLAGFAGRAPYPPELSRLIGYEADSAEPFALLHAYRGEPARAHAGRLLNEERRDFQTGLLTGLSWLAAAGIAHRGLDPDRVRWDGVAAQITGFGLATLVGTPRSAVGAFPWAAPEQRAGRVSGPVTERDDIWAAGRVIYYVLTEEELTDRAQLSGTPELEETLSGVFAPPEERPLAREILLERLRAPDPVPRGAGGDPLLARGRADFFTHRERKSSQVRREDPPGPPAERPAPSGRRARRGLGRFLGLLALLLAFRERG